MAVTPRRVLHALLAALLVVAALAALDGWRLWGEQRLNEAIAAGGRGGEAAGARPELRFALAHAQAASGAHEAAQARYGALQEEAGPLGRAARYNAANLLLRQALELRAAAHPGQALALIELAKEHYRELLRRDPEDWDARYNLERAQRLQPDPDAEEETLPDNRRDAERAATTMRGHSPGLP